MTNDFYSKLDYYIPNPKCELDYNKDYELLIATILSAQCTDKRVNIVTKELFKKYKTINDIANCDINELRDLIKPCGSHTKKSIYIKEAANNICNNYNGTIPNNRKYLESLKGVGRKTANVVLKNLFNEPCIPVDTHVIRVSTRLGLSRKDSPELIEKSLMKKIPKDKWNKVGEQILLFGRYYCKAINPECSNCLFNSECKYYKKIKRD